MSMFKPIITPEANDGLTFFPPVVFPILDPPPAGGVVGTQVVNTTTGTSTNASPDPGNPTVYTNPATESGQLVICFHASAYDASGIGFDTAPAGWTIVNSPGGASFRQPAISYIWKIVDGTEGSDIEVVLNDIDRSALPAIAISNPDTTTPFASSVFEPAVLSGDRKNHTVGPQSEPDAALYLGIIGFAGATLPTFTLEPSNVEVEDSWTGFGDDSRLSVASSDTDITFVWETDANSFPQHLGIAINGS